MNRTPSSSAVKTSVKSNQLSNSVQLGTKSLKRKYPLTESSAKRINQLKVNATKNNAEAAKNPRSNIQLHHRIPEQVHGHAAMKKSIAAGFNPDGSKNITLLPRDSGTHKSRQTHNGPHPKYTATIKARLNEIHTDGKKNGWSPNQYRSAIEKLAIEKHHELRKLNKPLK